MSDCFGLVQPLLTDFYQINMAYAYWKSNKTRDHAVFDLFFRKNPFSGEFTLFAGLADCIEFLKNFRYTDEDISYLRTVLPETTDTNFFDYLSHLDCREISLWSVAEGSVVFPRVPLIRIEGPLIVCQLLETTLLNLVNYASLVTTNAARFRIAAGESIQLLEFGLRRAQGPDGALSASRYCYLGGFDGTSNVLAGKLFSIPVKGTHAHAYVTAFGDIADLPNKQLKKANTDNPVEFVALCQVWHQKLASIIEFLPDQANPGELTAFVAYALAFPDQFLCLVDTYDVIRSGIPNFCAVALSLHDAGYRPIGVRIDSGDLAYLSSEVRRLFRTVATKLNIAWFANLTIVASNDINEDTIHSINQQGHAIDSFGIGTHLVTCQKQPALGCVYKLVEINGRPCIKLSEDVDKMTIPGKKVAYRFYGKDGLALVDYMQRPDEAVPNVNSRVLCRHPHHPAKRAYVAPAKVAPLYNLYWADGKKACRVPTLAESRSWVITSLASLRSDHKRALNPTPYKVSVSDALYHHTQDMWLQSAPISELS